jgi:CHAT domain-containing protein
MTKLKSFLTQITALDSPWPSDKTYLATLDVEPHRVWGLDTTLQPFSDSSDLQTSLQDIERVIEACNKTTPESPEPQRVGDDKAAVFLKRSCARLLRWIHVGSDDIASISDIHADAQVAERAYKEAEDIIGFSWTSFVADMGYIICEHGVESKIRGKTLGKRIVDCRNLSDTAAYVCLRLARKLRLGESHLQASGDFDRVSRLLLYGVGLCEATSNKIILAQMHATYGRVMVEKNQHAVASEHFERAYSYAIFEHGPKMPQDAFKPVVDEILKSLTEVGDDEGLRHFYNKLEETWPLRFTDENAKAKLRHWTNQNSMWKRKVELRRLVRGNRFQRAQSRVAKIFAEERPRGNIEAMMELYRRTNLGMNYGQLDLARKTIEELDKEPYNIFSTLMQWDGSDHDTWVAFVICVERTAFANSIRFLKCLERSPSYLKLSHNPRDHKLEDYQKLVHVARVYIFQERWTEALGLLKCSCSLITQQRQKIADEEIQQSQYGSSDAEKAFDWTVWVCLHFHTTSNSPAPRVLDKDAIYNSWSEEALRYSEMGKARCIGDSLRKQRSVEPTSTKAAPRSSQYTELLSDQDLLSELSAWLDSDTLVIHLTLIHEGLGLICLDTSGIHYAQWFSGLPGFGTWDVQRLTSVIFTIVENGNNPHRLETKPEERKKFSGAINELSTALIAPIEALLKTLSPQRICFIPAGHLTRVPFAALELNSKPLLEKFAVYQAPSLIILKELSKTNKAKPRGLENVSVVARSSHVNQTSLPATAMECVDAADQFGTTGHLESAVGMDKQRFIDLFEQSDVIHVGTHGEMDYERPLRSCIRLQEDFSVSDLQRVRSRAKLVFLSACFTGLGFSTLTDDMTGFQAKILESGALAFAGSLWNAHDLASLFFAHFFYEQLSSPENLNQSLADIFTAAQRRLRKLGRHEAQGIVDKLRERWARHEEAEDIPSDLLRDSATFFDCYRYQSRDDFASPYFWAPFVLIGHSSLL